MNEYSLKEMNYKNLIDMVSEDYDYIGLVITPWHALSLIGAIKKAESIYGEMKGIILILKNPNEQYLVDDNYFFNVNADVYRFNGERTKVQHFWFELLMINYSLIWSKIDSKKRKNFFILSHNYPHIALLSIIERKLRKKRNVMTIICDEGVGSYTDDMYDRLEQFKHDGSSKLKIIKNWFEEMLLCPKVIKNLINNNNYFDYCMLRGKYDLKPNGDLPKYIKNQIYDYSHSINYSYPIIVNDYVLINTQFFTKNEVNDTEKIGWFWKKIIDFYKEKGLEVWIKPHPREKELDIYASLGAKIIYEKNIAQEVLLMKMKKPKYLLSLYSTTLVTAPLINGVPSVCLGKLSLNSEGFTNSYKKYVEKFINKFKNITMVIDSWEELPFEVTDEE